MKTDQSPIVKLSYYYVQIITLYVPIDNIHLTHNILSNIHLLTLLINGTV